jgi:hypothetical protein
MKSFFNKPNPESVVLRYEQYCYIRDSYGCKSIDELSPIIKQEFRADVNFINYDSLSVRFTFYKPEYKTWFLLKWNLNEYIK